MGGGNQSEISENHSRHGHFKVPVSGDDQKRARNASDRLQPNPRPYVSGRRRSFRSAEVNQLQVLNDYNKSMDTVYIHGADKCAEGKAYQGNAVKYRKI